MKLFITFLFLIPFLLLKAESSITTIDSLTSIIQLSKNDTNTLKALNEIAFIHRINNQDIATNYIKKAIELGLKIKANKYLAYSFRVASLISYYKSDYTNALDYSKKSYDLYLQHNDYKGASYALNLTAIIYSNQGFFDKSIQLNKKCLLLRIQVSDSIGIAGSYNNLGLQFLKLLQYDSALFYYHKAVSISEKIQNTNSLGMYYANVGTIYESLKNADSLKKYLDKSYQVRIKLNDKQQWANIYEAYGDYYQLINKTDSAIFYFEKSLIFAQEIKIAYEIESITEKLHTLYFSKGKFDKAYQILNLYRIIHDSINKNDVALLITRTELESQYEKEKEITRLKNEKVELENQKTIERQKSIRNTLIIVALSILMISLLIYRNYKRKRKDNILLAEKNEILFNQKEEIAKINETLHIQKNEIQVQRDDLELLNHELLQKNEEISTQRDEIEAQRNLVIFQKNKIEKIYNEVTDSINYAKRIQDAVLPISNNARNILNEHFIFFKPRNIVSGDFYWSKKINNNIVIVVADCTGHGVPGAFMSMLGISFLNEIIQKKEINEAGIILDLLRNEIINALNENKINDNNSQKMWDGMDISIVIINESNYNCQFAGANHCLYLIKEANSLDIQELKGDNMPIGQYPVMKPFTTTHFTVEKDDCLYLFTDGFVDQFGGKTGKKYKYQPFKELLLQNHNQPMEYQLNVIEKEFYNWKGNLEQVDDITVIGKRI